MPAAYYDAHLHPAAPSLLGQIDSILATCSEVGINRMVCNGTCPDDWASGLSLARTYPQILPAVGLHPWKVQEAHPGWKEQFLDCLDRGRASVGEIGLDQWIRDYDSEQQKDAFCFQMKAAAERDLPVSIHCLQATGPLMELLRYLELPRRGFHIHAYSGSPDLINELIRLGAYFSFNAGQIKPGRQKIRDCIRAVPKERLLIETDAPDFLPLPEHRMHTLQDPHLNHPANLLAGYQAIAALRSIDLEDLAEQVEINFLNYFGDPSAPFEGPAATT